MNEHYGFRFGAVSANMIAVYLEVGRGAAHGGVTTDESGWRNCVMENSKLSYGSPGRVAQCHCEALISDVRTH